MPGCFEGTIGGSCAVGFAAVTEIMRQRDVGVVVIGGGSAGYPAAIRAAQNGLSAACIDAWQNHDGSRRFGGTCLNAGCIPSKALLVSSELYHRAASEFASHGIAVGKLGMEIATMQSRKAGIVEQRTTGIASRSVDRTSAHQSTMDRACRRSLTKEN